MPGTAAVKPFLRRSLKAAAGPLPPKVRRLGGSVLHARSRGVRERPILGVPLQVEGANHGQVDKDDAWLIALLSEASGFLDVGCNVGYFALAGCVLDPEMHVLAIDANPRCAVATAGNLVRNGFGDRTRAVASFVSDAPGEVMLHAVGLGAASALPGLAQTAEAVGESVKVASNTLDAIVEKTGSRPDLVKIDVEGAEREVLAGAEETIDRYRPRIMVEMHSGGDLTMAGNISDVLQWCSEHGYAAWYLATGQRLSDAGPVSHRGRCHFLLQAADQAFPDVLDGIGEGDAVATALDKVQKR